MPPEARVVFIADRDLWVISGIPERFASRELIFTAGYSLENDMFKDGNLENLLVGDERRQFHTETHVVCRWFALAASRRIAGIDESLDVHPNELLDDSGRRSALMALADGEIYPEALANRISNDYALLVRGKTLFALLIRHCGGHGHSYRTLLNFGASQNGPLLSLILSKVETYLRQG